MRNETFIYIENRSRKDLKNVIFSVHPISQGESGAKLMTAEVMSTGLERSSHYKSDYDQSRNTFTIALPVLGNSESILLSQVFDRPVGFVTELIADDFTSRNFFSSGCASEIDVNDIPERFGIGYVGSNCKIVLADKEPRNSCTYTDESPIKLTEDMSGAKFVEEQFIVQDPLLLKVPRLVPKR